MEKDSKELSALLDAIDQQLQSPKSPYVKVHFDRLIALGESPEEAKKMLASVLAVEMWEISTLGRPFDEANYISRLSELPQQSWLDQE